MALRYLARRVCTPALQQRALVPRVPPSAGSRPLCTRGSSHPQGALINESKADAASKGKKEPERDFSKLTDKQICQKLEEVDSTYKAAIEDIKEFARYQAMQTWFMMGSVAAGAGLGFLHIAYNIRKERKITLGAKGI